MTDAVVQSFLGQNQSATNLAVANIDAKPDDAAEALHLENISGYPAITIEPDLATVKAQQKAKYAAEIVKGNPYISDYVNSHPLASKVSNDDYGNLDQISQSATKLGQRSILGAAATAFKEGVGEEPVGAWMLHNASQDQLEQIMRNPISRLGWAALSTLQSPLEVPMRIIAGGITGFAGGAAETARQAGYEDIAKRFEMGAQAALDPALFVSLQGIPNPLGLFGGKYNAKLHDMVQAAKPYIEEGKEPPVGIDPTIDKIHVEQSKQDLANLDDLLSDVQKSQTKVRSPEMFQKFMDQHFQDTKIGISGEKIAELYKDKEPVQGDNLLGWVPDIAEQLKVARETGGDIEVSLSEWLTRIEPDLAKELHDDIRVRPNGLTKNEFETVSEMAQVESLESNKTKFEMDTEEFLKQNNLPPISNDQMISNMQGRIRQIEYDRRASKIEGEPYPPNAELFTLRKRIKELNKQVVDTVRQSAAVDEPLLQRQAEGWGKQDFAKAAKLFATERRKIGTEAEAMVPKEGWFPYEQKAIDAANTELDRLLPKRDFESVPSRNINISGKQALGAYINYTDRIPLIAYLVNPDTAAGTIRHEAIHHLRQQGFFSKEEWQTLKDASFYNDWIEKHDIKERYAGKSAVEMLEESIAEEFKAWRHDPVEEGLVNRIFSKLSRLADSVKDAVTRALGGQLQANEVFKRIENGEIGSREGTKPLDPRTFAEAEETEKSLFAKANSIGMTVDQYKRYMKLIDQRNVEDMEAQFKRAQQAEKERQTPEWKENLARVTEEARKDVEGRPDIAAGRFFIEGKIGDQELQPKPRLATDKLTQEQQNALPRNFQAKNGYPPDEIANLFGYQTGNAMIERLIELDQARAGKRFQDHVDAVVKEEANSRMEKQYGNLDKNVLDEAYEHVLKPTQMDILHEEMLATGVQAGADVAPFTKEAVKDWVTKRFNDLPTATIKTEKYLKDAGRAGREAELALLKGDPGEAFKAKQKQYLSVLLANEAKKFEKEKGKFDSLAKKFSKRDVENTSTEYVNYIQDMLLRLGQPLRRSVQDLQEAISKEGYASFENFVADKEASFRDIFLPEFFDEKFQKNADELSVEQFRAINKSIQAMAFHGRDELKIDRAGEKRDRAEIIDQMKEKLADLGVVPVKIDRKPNPIADKTKFYWWGSINLESILNRVDKDNPRGVFYQTIVRPFAEASNYKDKLIKDYQGQLAKLTKIDRMDNLVENSIFKDPTTDQPFIMRRRNVLGILQNVGNASNLEKLAKGYGLNAPVIMDWLKRNTTKEDWDRAQAIGDVFNDLFSKADTMSHNVNGVGIEKVDLQPIETPFGTYKGWYNPVKYDRKLPQKSKALIGPDTLESEGNFRATTPQGYTKSRSGYIGPQELNLDVVPQRMNQMIHDIATRPAVVQLAKIFHDPEFMNAIKKHLGPQRAAQFIPFLRDFANAANFMSDTAKAGNDAVEFFRQNTIATLIGLNPGTVMKHGTTALFNSTREVGLANWTREAMSLLKSDPVTQERNWSMAMDKSEELQRRMRNWSDVIQGHGSEVNLRGGNTKFMTMREAITNLGAKPVSLSDLFSAVPTFLAKYKEEIANGSDEGLAVDLGNRAVRRAHGSSVLTNKPEIMRTNSLGAFFTSLYGFFSHMQQKQYEVAWKAADMYQSVMGKGVGDQFRTYSRSDIVMGLMSFVIIPAVIEELVTPYEGGEKDSWGMKAAKTLAFGMGSSLVGVRDFVRATINLRDPSAGLIGTSLKAGTDVARDLSNPKTFTKEKVGNLIKHTTALTGVLTGLTNEQEGKIMEYLWRYNQNLERPRGPWDVAVGLRYGKTDKHSRSFDEYMRHMVPHK